MAAILGETKFFENWDGYFAGIPYGSKILLKSLYLAQFSRYKAFLCFCNFCEKFENSKWPPFFGKIQNFFLKIGDSYSAEIPCGVKNFVEIALSSRVFEI